MNLLDFLKLARDMRAAQKSFFKSRLPGDVAKAKDLEKRFDLALEEGVTVLETKHLTEPTMDEAIQLGLLNDEDLANMGIQRPTDEEGE